MFVDVVGPAIYEIKVQDALIRRSYNTCMCEGILVCVSENISISENMHLHIHAVFGVFVHIES